LLPSCHDVENVRFRAGDGVELEGELREPDAEARGSAVICHPHPQQGGSKDHPLLWAIRNDLAARSIAVLTFNFRGVMGSEGEHAEGVDEVMDARSAVDRVLRSAPGPTFMAGWSFGANVALREAMEDERVAALALVGMPLAESATALPDLPGRSELARFDRPVLLVAGEADQFCPVPEVRSLARRLPRAEVAILSGTDHFFWKREREVGALIGDFVERTLFAR
jgi:alpha/beta superfamily hydrolase